MMSLVKVWLCLIFCGGEGFRVCGYAWREWLFVLFLVFDICMLWFLCVLFVLCVEKGL